MTRRIVSHLLDYAAAGVTGIAILILAPGCLLGAVAYLVMGCARPLEDAAERVRARD